MWERVVSAIKKAPIWEPFLGLHIRVSRPTRAFRRDPRDVLRRILDVTGLAVHAVLGVDLEALGAVFLGDHFIHASRAVTLRRFIVERQVGADRDARVFQLQVARLLFFMVERPEHPEPMDQPVGVKKVNTQEGGVHGKEVPFGRPRQACRTA